MNKQQTERLLAAGVEVAINLMKETIEIKPEIKVSEFTPILKRILNKVTNE